MKRMWLRARLRRTCDTTSTTGPQVRLAQYAGVANATTNGRCARIESATENAYSARSGFGAVVSGPSRPCVVASVGVPDRGAGAPIAGEYELFLTMTLPSAAIRAPLGRASNQYVPGSGASRCAT